MALEASQGLAAPPVQRYGALFVEEEAASLNPEYGVAEPVGSRERTHLPLPVRCALSLFLKESPQSVARSSRLEPDAGPDQHVVITLIGRGARGALTVGGSGIAGDAGREMTKDEAALGPGPEAEAGGGNPEATVHQSAQELAALLDITMTFSVATDSDSLVRSILERCASLFDAADAGALFNYDPDGDNLVAKASIG